MDINKKNNKIFNIKQKVIDFQVIINNYEGTHLHCHIRVTDMKNHCQSDTAIESCCWIVIITHIMLKKLKGLLTDKRINN